MAVWRSLAHTKTNVLAVSAPRMNDESGASSKVHQAGAKVNQLEFAIGTPERGGELELGLGSVSWKVSQTGMQEKTTLWPAAGNCGPFFRLISLFCSRQSKKKP